MEKIAELQQQLHALYEKPSAAKLSDRSCALILLKLMASGALDLVHTMDGGEYVTRQHLDREIRREVQRAGGRLPVVELQPLLNIDLSVIEDRIKLVVANPPSNSALNNSNTIASSLSSVTTYSLESELLYYRVQADLVSSLTLFEASLFSFCSDYFDRVAGEVRAMLGEQGSLSFNLLLNRFNLPTDFFTQVFLDRYGASLDAVIEDQTLYTGAYLAQCTCEIRGLFAACTDCVTMNALYGKLNGLGHGSSMSQKTFFRIVEQLQRDGALAGTMKGTGLSCVYTPTLYERARLKFVREFLAHNDYLDLSLLTQMGITQTEKYFQENNICGYQLKSTFVDESVLANLNSTIEEAMKESSWFDCTTLIRFSLGTDDWARLLGLASAVKELDKKNPEIVILRDEFVVSMSFVKLCLQKFEEYAKEREEKAPSKESSSLANSTETPKESSAKGKGGNQATSTAQKGGGKGGKGKRGGEGKRGKGDSDWEEPQVSNSNSKQQEKETQASYGKVLMQLMCAESNANQLSVSAKGNKKTNTNLSNSNSNTNAASSATSKETNATKESVAAGQGLGLVEEKRLRLFYQLLAEFAKSTLTGIEQSIKQNAVKIKLNSVMNVKERIKDYQKRIDLLYLNILMFEKSLQSVTNATLSLSLSIHLQSTLCEDLLNTFAEYQLLLEQNTVVLIVDAGQRKKQCAALSKEFVTSLNDVETSKKTSLAAFLSSLQKLAETHSIHLRALDAKSARTLHLSHKHQLMEQLTTSVTAVNSEESKHDAKARRSNLTFGLFLVLSILHIKYVNSIVHVDHKNLNHLKCLLDNIKEKLEQDKAAAASYSQLSEYYDYCCEGEPISEERGNEAEKTLKQCAQGFHNS